MELKVLSFWHYMLHQLFRVESQRLRERLWQAYPKSTSLRWQLALCGEPAASPHVVYERVKILCGLLDPGLLIRTAEGLTPVGKLRPKELRQFEETVLKLVDAHGKFKWWGEEQTNGQKRTAPRRRA
jgi:hypothetical protein